MKRQNYIHGSFYHFSFYSFKSSLTLFIYSFEARRNTPLEHCVCVCSRLHYHFTMNKKIKKNINNSIKKKHIGYPITYTRKKKEFYVSDF